MRIFSATKKQALSEAHIGCLGDVYSLNIARGCGGGCVFCYARCYTGTPEPGTLLLYQDMPKLLRQQLGRLERKGALPGYVLMSTATDCFLGGPQVSQLSRACVEILLNRQIGLSISTRGTIPDDLVVLLGRHAPHVRVTVPIISLSEAYTRAWEPGTASPQQRLFLIQRLLRAGIQPTIRMEPLIPFVNDLTKGLRDLASALVSLGLSQATLGFLHLRPGVRDQLTTEAPADLRRLVLGSFQPRSDRRFLHIATKQRTAGLKRVQRIGREHGLKISACHCQNPGIPAARCTIAPPTIPQPKIKQETLF